MPPRRSTTTLRRVLILSLASLLRIRPAARRGRGDDSAIAELLEPGESLADCST
jgi:hypothetical protein